MALTFREVETTPKKLSFREVEPEVAEPKKKPTGVLRELGLGVRGIAEGVADTLGIVGDPLNTIVNQFLPDDRKLSTLKEATRKTLTQMGVPEPETATEEFINEVIGVASGTLTMAGAAKTGTGVVARELAKEPIKQVVAGEAGYLGGRAAQEVLPDTPASGLMGTVLGAVAGGKAAGMGTTAKTPEMLRRGKELGVDVLTTDVMPPKTALGKYAQMATERMPLGTQGMRVKQVEQQKQMLSRFYDEIGADVPEDLKVSLIEDVVTKRKGIFQRYAGLKKQVFDKLENKGSVPAIKLTKVLDDEIAIAEHKNLGAYAKELKNFKDQVTSATQPAGAGQVKQANIKSMDEARALFGEKLKTDEFKGLREHIGKSQNKIYAAFKEDLGNFIKKEGGDRDYRMWKAVNKKLTDTIRQEEMTTFKAALKKATVEPETVERMIRTKRPSVAKQLYRAASPRGKKLIRAAVIQDIVDRAGGIENLTPKKFMNEVSKRGRILNIYFDAKNRKVLSSMVQLLKDTSRAGEAAKYTPTGAAAIGPMAGLSVITHYFGLGAAATGAVGMSLASRLMETKATRDLLLKYRVAPGHKKAAIARQLNDAIIAFQKEEENNE